MLLRHPRQSIISQKNGSALSERPLIRGLVLNSFRLINKKMDGEFFCPVDMLLTHSLSAVDFSTAQKSQKSQKTQKPQTPNPKTLEGQVLPRTRQHKLIQ